MSIVLELQREALDSDSDILALLRKALLVARKLKLTEFGEWINNELNGYTKQELIPEYRKVNGEVKAWNPYNGWIPVVPDNNEISSLITSRKVADSIPKIQSLLPSESQFVVFTFPPEINALLVNWTSFESKYQLFVGKNAMHDIVERVKSEILEWAIILEENDILGENLRFTDEEKNKAQSEPGIINYISNFYGDVSDSQIQQGTKNSTQKRI